MTFDMAMREAECGNGRDLTGRRWSDRAPSIPQLEEEAAAEEPAELLEDQVHERVVEEEPGTLVIDSAKFHSRDLFLDSRLNCAWANKSQGPEGAMAMGPLKCSAH